VKTQQPISSWEQLREQVVPILKKINAEPALALAAGVNPILALEELGYRIEPQALFLIEARLRFDPQQIERLQQLQEEIFRHAKHEFDIRSASELGRVLFEELKIPVPGQGKKRSPQEGRPALDTSPLPHRYSGQPEAEDPLEALRGAHPILEPLLEYRRLEASRPRLAPRPIYEEVRQGKRRLPIQKIRGRFKTSE
jgi:DNA polymerase I-like protein with 3'-5' exonuclease and polymerase domains